MNINRGLTPLAAVILLAGSFALTGCDNQGSPQDGQQKAPEVGVVTLKSVSLTVTTDLPGRTNPFRVAEVRPQVSGIILKRNFIEGSDVKTGQSLYQIDPATYQAAWDSAKGDLAQAQANAKIAALTVKRYKPLLGTGYVSQQDYDTALATQSQTAAAVQAAQAALETARINLAYTKVISPISGRIGKSAVTEGALVQNGQTTAMATVQQLDPIYVDITQSSNDYSRLRNEMKSGQLQQVNGKATVKLVTQDGKVQPQSGTLEFSDVTVDETTGSITLRAIFPNPQHDLLPGMFVRARLDEGIKPDALLVPQQAITRTPTGQATTMVVGSDNKVSERNVTAAQAIGDKWLVTEGLQSGEKVIVTGLQRVKPGVTVTPEEIGETAPAKASAPSEPSKP